jgi:hypothetical protein
MVSVRQSTQIPLSGFRPDAPFPLQQVAAWKVVPVEVSSPIDGHPGLGTFRRPVHQ